MPFLPLLELGPKFSASEISGRVNGNGTGSSGVRGHRNSEPVRPRASPRSTPPPQEDRRSHVQFDLKMNEAETMYLSSGDQSPVRGRTLRRMPACDRIGSISKARTMSIRSDAIDMTTLRERLMSRDMTETPEQYYEESLLEPRPLERLRSCSLSEELHWAAKLDDDADLTQFIGHRDTFALLGIHRLHNRAIYLPDSFFRAFAGFIDFETYKSLRLSCRHWSQGVTSARPLRLPAASKLPPEILEKIYVDLAPVDFDAARRTCRGWMIASLEESLLLHKLEQGGWHKAMQLDMARLERGHGRRMSITSGNWLLSKRLATECALLSGWPDIKHDESGRPGSISGKRRGPLTLASTIDFSELSHTKGKIELGDPPLHFHVSVCQTFLLVTKAHTIYIYNLRDPYDNPPHEYGGYIRGANVLHCPQRVLAVSMNTSSGRLSVAALLGDRLGIVFEMHCEFARSQAPSSPSASQTNHQGSSDGYGTPTDVVAYNADGSYGMQTFSERPETMGAASGPRSIYKNVCSAQDPPKSVAICPQRRCVAFGNATGIEVHWIDALSGQDLQRWFPLSSCCDCLCFLPNRIGIDSPRKLRIMASAAHPVQAQIAARMYPARTEMLNKKGPWDDFTSEDQAWKLNWAFSRMSPARSSQTVPQHYNARPLSDGNATLFTDPPGSKLALGGGRLDEGLPQLERRYIFEGPPAGYVPYLYAAASELRWGVRILAGYANEKDIDAPKQLWLFTVPPDYFVADQGKKTASEDSTTIEEAPMVILGLHVADVPSLSEVAVDATDGDLTLRAFTPEAGGKALTWQLAVDKDTIQKVVLEDGVTIPVVTHGYDDTVMEDANSIMTWRMDNDFDGTSSPTLRAVSQQRITHPLDELTTQLDADGDTPMLDAPLCPSPVPPPPQPQPRTPSPTPPAPLFFPPDLHRRTPPRQEDEGYASGDDNADNAFEAARSPFAIHVPPVHGNWDESDDWVPQYLAEHGAGIEDEGLGVDVWESTRLEMDILGL